MVTTNAKRKYLSLSPINRKKNFEKLSLYIICNRLEIFFKNADYSRKITVIAGEKKTAPYKYIESVEINLESTFLGIYNRAIHYTILLKAHNKRGKEQNKRVHIRKIKRHYAKKQ